MSKGQKQRNRKRKRNNNELSNKENTKEREKTTFFKCCFSTEGQIVKKFRPYHRDIIKRFSSYIAKLDTLSQKKKKKRLSLDGKAKSFLSYRKRK